MEPKTGGYISEIYFNNNESIRLNEDDIVVFVGPNNVGKSQSLKDLYVLCEKKMPTKVIKNIELTKYNFDIMKFLEKNSKMENHGSYKQYNFMRRSITDSDIECSMNKNNTFYYLRDFFIANLITDNRLSITNPVEIVDRDRVYSNPIHYVAYNSDRNKWLSDNFKKAFGKEITANSLHGRTIPICIGKNVGLSEVKNNNMQDALNEYANILENYDKVHEQGDGIRSFTGILLYLMMNNYCIYLIDEPESFLHAPQANIMGRILAENTKNKQVFISTHNEEIIKGLLSTSSSRIKIIRITREENVNSFSVLNNEDIEKVWTDPILKHSNILASLFHKQVILCESDSDCKMYSIIEDVLCLENERYSETLYIHCGGKHRIAKVAKALKALDINVKIITDIDVLNDENIFRGIAESVNIDWNTIESNYKVLISNLHSSKEKVKKDEVKFVYESVINSAGNELKKEDIKRLQDVLKIESPWNNIKSNGKIAFKAGDQTEAFNKIDAILKENQIYIVPKGELEGFIKTVGGHGPEWVNKVLEKYPDFNNQVYNDIKEFIKEIID